ncbi:MAG TPA: carboxymuconolactone decarboxylase family protein [bacterium]|nr:carboxymuconolactone decarboxylase family protein [bacterium]
MELDAKLSRLIAVGAAVAANCRACVEYHCGQGAAEGLTNEEMAAAAAVGRKVRQGAAAGVDAATEQILTRQQQPGAGAPCACTC